MKVSDLRGILQYVPRFRGRIFVVAVDGDIAGSPNFGNILLDIAVLRSLSIKVVLVHGASQQISRLAEERGITISDARGIGITDEPTLKLSIEAASRLTMEIMQGLTTVDLRAAYANSIIAHPAGILGGRDYLNTGRVERVDTKCLEVLLNEGILPVIPPMGFDGEGRTYRVNSDNIAVEIAVAMRAMKLIFMSRHDGVILDGEITKQLSIAETEDVLRRKRVKSANVLSKLEHAVAACRQGVPRVHLLNGHVDEALLSEVFSHEGVGTMIYSNEYQQIRRIFKKDVRAMMALIRESVNNEELIRRRRADIVNRIEDYWVMEIDRTMVACVALHVYPDQNIGEIACLHVSKHHANEGFGAKLMKFVEDLARSKGLEALFALSTRAFMYFQQKGGYQETTAEVLPPDRREKYEQSQRNSKVLIKPLSAHPVPPVSRVAH
jgi:amino-acid N-acetyltransferase